MHWYGHRDDDREMARRRGPAFQASVLDGIERKVGRASALWPQPLAVGRGA